MNIREQPQNIFTLMKVVLFVFGSLGGSNGQLGYFDNDILISYIIDMKAKMAANNNCIPLS